VIAIIGILVALLLPAIQAAREAARRAACTNNIKNVAIAVLNYESDNKMLPEGMTFDPNAPGNNPIHTLSQFGPNWIIKILPKMEEQALYDSFDYTMVNGKRVWTPINQPGANNKNIEARGKIIPSLLCPSDPNNTVRYEGHPASSHGANWARTNYAASAGRDFIHQSFMNGPASKAWSGRNAAETYNLMCLRGVMGPNAAVALEQIIDGTSKTILLAEIRAGLTQTDARGVWAMGHAGASLVARYGSGGDANGPNFCSPSSDDVYAETITTGGNASCGGTPDAIGGPECMSVSSGQLFDQATARSKHPGGVHVAFADGSVQFINDEIETSGCFQACCTVWDYMILSSDETRPGPYNSPFSGRGGGNLCMW
jgi:prepilin-type processing-associated H-X9-DG protein